MKSCLSAQKRFLFFKGPGPFKIFFKGPRPFKNQKTYLSGLTTPQGALLDNVASGVENWIAERPFFGFCVIPEWGVLKSYSFYDIIFLLVRGFSGERSGDFALPNPTCDLIDSSLFSLSSFYKKMDFSKVSVYSDPDFSYNSFAEPVVFLLTVCSGNQLEML